jgi:hypothetical protein
MIRECPNCGKVYDDSMVTFLLAGWSLLFVSWTIVLFLYLIK